MTLKTLSQVVIWILPLIILSSLVLSPYTMLLTSENLEAQDSLHFRQTNVSYTPKIPMIVAQENTTDITNSTTPTTPTEITNTTEDTNTTTDTDVFPPWRPILEPGLYYPLALVFSILGILSTLWLIFFVETSKDRTIRERLIGTTIRLVFMSVLLGLGIHFWVLFEPI